MGNLWEHLESFVLFLTHLKTNLLKMMEEEQGRQFRLKIKKL
jgi:hypothetical protein